MLKPSDSFSSCIHKYFKRTAAWLGLTIGIVNIVAESLLFAGFVLQRAPVTLEYDGFLRFIFASACFAIWYYWKDAK